MSGFLLDTHVFLWLIAAPEKVGDRLLGRLSDERNEVYLSAASCWEIAIKCATGKLDLPADPAVYVPDHMRRTGVAGLAIESAHALRVASLPLHHRDPFDRLLVAQATGLDLQLVTADRTLEHYDVELVMIGGGT